MAETKTQKPHNVILCFLCRRPLVQGLAASVVTQVHPCAHRTLGPVWFRFFGRMVLVRGVIVFGQMPGESGFDRDLDCGQGQEGAATWGCLEISEGSDPFVFIFRSFLVIFWGIERHGGCAI